MLTWFPRTSVLS